VPLCAGHADRFEEFADEMVRLNVDVIIVVTTPAAQAAKRATTTIPIVHPAVIDPVGTGLVASLARPGGNLTGLAIADLSTQRLELLKELIHRLSNGAVLWNADNPANAVAWKETGNAARGLAVTLRSYEVRDAHDFEGAFARIVQQRADLLYVLHDAPMLGHRKQIIDFANRNRLPSTFVGKEWVGFACLNGIAARHPTWTKILRGAKPADMPVEQPTLFELACNLKPQKRSA
jgi:putative ABC transport system substrate-binding protein